MLKQECTISRKTHRIFLYAGLPWSRWSSRFSWSKWTWRIPGTSVDYIFTAIEIRLFGLKQKLLWLTEVEEKCIDFCNENDGGLIYPLNTVIRYSIFLVKSVLSQNNCRSYEVMWIMDYISMLLFPFQGLPGPPGPPGPIVSPNNTHFCVCRNEWPFHYRQKMFWQLSWKFMCVLFCPEVSLQV